MSNSYLRRHVGKHYDEFYTRYIDIENEVKDFEPFFKDKIVYCPCDSLTSNFVKYFQNNFEKLGLKKLNFSSNDFRSEKSIQTLIKSDIIITNPPFSYIKEFINILMQYKKKFLIIGTRQLIKYKGYFKYFKNSEIWVTNSKRENCKIFLDIHGKEKNIDCYWYTNIGEYSKKDFLYTGCKYNESYPKYFNCESIEVSSIKKIPDNYYGLMAVPLNFIEYLNFDQFELLYSSIDVPLTKIRKSYKNQNKVVYIDIESNQETYCLPYTRDSCKVGNVPCFFKDKELVYPFSRIFIRRKRLE